MSDEQDPPIPDQPAPDPAPTKQLRAGDVLATLRSATKHAEDCAVASANARKSVLDAQDAVTGVHTDLAKLLEHAPEGIISRELDGTPACIHRSDQAPGFVVTHPAGDDFTVEVPADQ